MSLVTECAGRVAQRLVDGYKVSESDAFDPSIFAAIAAAIVQVIQALGNCLGPGPAPAAALARLKSPSWLDKLRLRFIVNRVVRQEANHELQKLSPKIQSALLDVAREVSQDDLSTCFMEVAGMVHLED